MGEAMTLFCLSDLDVDNWIDIAAIVVNGGLAILIVLAIQNNFTNKRVLKDHFINEVKDIQSDFRAFFTDIASDRLESKEVLAWFKLMNIRITDLMDQLKINYGTETDMLNPFQTELRNMTTDSLEYISLFSSGGPITFTSSTKTEYLKFQQRNLKLFNKLIVQINNSKR